MGNTYTGGNTALQALIDSGPLTVGLYLISPGLSGGGIEVSSVGYSRPVITFTVPDMGAMSNMETVSFPQAQEHWGEVRAWAIFNDDGVMIRFGTFSHTKTVGIGDFVIIAAGGITLSEYGDAVA
jgi:hypothetical protein